MTNIAIVAVAYNRVDSLSRLLSSLSSANYSKYHPTLIISVDKSGTDVVEKFAEQYSWIYGDKIVDKHEKNLGLREHMLSLGKWFNRFEAIIVLEDDIVVSPCFFQYAIQCVDKYASNSMIAGISLYGFEINYQTLLPFQPIKDEHDAYFMNCAMSWGEIWMKESWQKFYEWYKLNVDFAPSDALPERICQWNKKSWLKYHTRYCIEQNLYFVHPYISLSTNYADAGEHNAVDALTACQTNLQRGSKTEFSLPDFSSKAICYDGFFENKSLCKHLNISEEETCVDLYGTQQNKLRKRYWLTTHKTSLPIIKSFGIRFRPIEMNVIESVEGSDIFLYEANGQCVPSQISSRAIKHLQHIDYFVAFLRLYGLKNLFKDICKYIH